MINKLLLAAALVLTPVAMNQNVLAQPGNNDKVTICHRTNSVKNPYVKITVSKNAVDGQGGNGDHYAEHQGPVATSPAVAQQLKDNKTEWGDIIPPVPGAHNGLNWTAEGQAMYNNNCNYVQPQQPPVTPPTPPVTPPTPPAAPRTTTGATLGTQTTTGNTLSTRTAGQADAASGGVEAGYGGAAGSLVAPLLGIAGSLASLGFGVLRLRKSE